MYSNRGLIKTLQRGFTLIELLIVVIILAILAAIIIPQFSGATADAQESALDADLNAMRSAIEVYRTQHGGVYPGSTVSSGGTSCAGTIGTGAINSAQAFMDQMQMASDASGHTCTVADAAYKYGPYVRKGIPADPIKLKTEIVVTTAGAPLAPASDAVGGWAYDTKSGQIVMNSGAEDSKQKAYSSH